MEAVVHSLGGIQTYCLSLQGYRFMNTKTYVVFSLIGDMKNKSIFYSSKSKANKNVDNLLYGTVYLVTKDK